MAVSSMKHTTLRPRSSLTLWNYLPKMSMFKDEAGGIISDE
jgi:hypothetical protein